MDNIIFKYSELFLDDGGMAKIKADFNKLGEDLISEAKRVKSEMSKNLTLDNPELLAKYESQVDNLVQMNNEYIKSKKDLEQVERQYIQAKKDALQSEIQAEKLKQEAIKTTKEEIRAMGELNKAIVTENNAKKSEIALSEATRKAREASLRSVKTEKDEYALLSKELNDYVRMTQNVAVQMYRLEEAGKKTTPQYKALENSFTSLQQKTLKLDSQLKAIDASIGRHQRNVGHYEKANWGLSNSINQLTRELPAFTFSAQTGLMGISNNIPILVDEIGKLNQANKNLVAQGKPTKSIIGQIASALFSFQTAMGVGILLMTVYGKEIGNWVKQMFGANEQLKKLKENQDKLNKSKTEGIKTSVDDREELLKNIAIAKDQKMPEDLRRIAIKKLRSDYTYYFKDLKDEEILLGKTADAQQKITTALEKRGQAELMKEVINEDKKRLEDIKAQIPLLEKKIQIEKTGRDEVIKAGAYTEESLKQSYSESAKMEKELKAIKKERVGINAQVESSEGKLLTLQKESIALDYKEEKAQKELNKTKIEQIKTVDYLASEYEWKKEVLENTISLNQEIFQEEKNTLEIRLDAQKNMVTQMLALAQMERDEKLRVLARTYELEKNETIKNGDGIVVAMKYSKQGLIELEKQYQYDMSLVKEQYREKEFQAMKKGEKIALLETMQWQIDNLRYLQKYLSTKSELYEEYSRRISAIQNQINQITDADEIVELKIKMKSNEYELEALRELAKQVEESKGRSTYEIIDKWEKRKTLLEKNYATMRKMNRIQAINEEQKSYEQDTNEWRNLEIEKQAILLELEKQGLKDRFDTQKQTLDKMKQMQEELNDIISAILDRMIDVAQTNIDKQEYLLNQQQSALEYQQNRAAQGLENTLAFEQKMMAKREAELLKYQKREQRLQKIKSLWTSYTNYSDKDPNTAVQKALRDFAILESITLSMGKGGAIEDYLPKDGIFKGASHRSQSKGIPILVEGKEGIFSKKEMNNMGKDTFYKMKELASNGQLNENFFERQRQDFIMSVMPVKGNDDKLVYSMREVVRAIEEQPKQSLEVSGLIDGVLDIVESVKKGKTTIRNHYKIQKPRI